MLLEMALSACIPSKKSILLVVTILAISLLLFDSYYSKVIISDFDLNKHIVKLHNRIFSSNTDIEVVANHSEKLIVTPGCTLPRTHLFPKKFSMKKNLKPNCEFEKRIVTIDDNNETLQLTEEGKNNAIENSCTVMEIIKRGKKDVYDYGREFNITDGEVFNITDVELFATKCGKHINFDGHFPINPSVQEKIDYWQQNQNDGKEPPFSVLFMGFDTTSRSHFHRSLQKTLPLMTEMGFVDFQGYHSVAPYTLENFLAFIVGMETKDVRDKCAGSWSTPFDKCPTIWKHFALNKFVTMYIEDGSQTFNWGGQGGFTERPTDYYPHPLFNSVPAYRHKFLDKKHDACMSTMNAQNFMLDYNKRFYKKFMKTPFFTFTWFSNPFHDSTYSLYGFDDSFHEFFQFLNSKESKELRERTLIILNSDHGERHGDFVKTGYEGFIERALAGLFIRLPDNLPKRFPKLKLQKSLELNSKRLTGGFDIYQTLLHLLQIQDLKMRIPDQISNLNVNESMDFEPVLRDRSSLFLPVSVDRTCVDINVKNGNCVCNTTSEASSIDNPFFTNKMINFAIDQLNTIIHESKYNDTCKKHGKPMLSFISASVLTKTEESTDAVIRFITNVDKAQFEVQLRIFHDNDDKEKIGKIERIGPFNRLNLYGDKSWCVDFVTDADKRMKEICHCKGKKPKKS